MKLLSWILLAVIIVFCVFYTYDYFTMPKIENISKANNCLTNTDIDIFGQFKNANYSIYLPKEWQFATLNAGNTQETYSFIINPNDNYEFFSIWSRDYNKDADALILETLKPITNYKIDLQDNIKTANGETLKKISITLKNESGDYKQELFAFVKNEKGYLLLARVKSQNYNIYTNTINKITCSFKVN